MLVKLIQNSLNNVNMLKEHLRPYSTKSKKYKVKTNQEVEGWRENQDSSNSLFPALQGYAPYTVPTLAELHKSPRYPKSQNSVSYQYLETGKSFSSTPKNKKSLFDIKTGQSLNIVYRNSVSNQSDWSYSILNKINEEKIKDLGSDRHKFSEDLLRQNYSEFDLVQHSQDDLETERIDNPLAYKGKLPGFSSKLNHKKILNYKIKNEEQKFNLLYGSEQDMIGKLNENKNVKKVKRVSHLNDIFCENTNKLHDEEIDQSSVCKSELDAEYCDSFEKINKDFKVGNDSPKKKYEIVINGVKNYKKELDELGEFNKSDSENEGIGDLAKKSSENTLRSKKDNSFAYKKNKPKEVSTRLGKSGVQTARIEFPANVSQNEEISKDFKNVNSQKYKINISKLNLETNRSDIIEEKSSIQTNNSPYPSKVTKKTPAPGPKKLRKLQNTKKNIKKPKKKKPLKSDSKRETKNTFKSTTMTESEEKSLYQTPDYSSPLSVLVSNSPDKLPTLYTLPEFDLENLNEKQSESVQRHNLKSGTLKTEFKSVEKFPLLRQKHIRDFTSPQGLNYSKSKKFSGKPSKTLILRLPSEPDSKPDLSMAEKVGSVDRFIKNFSNSMLASLHVMIVNLTSSLEALSSDKKLLELKKLNNFFGIYPELNSKAKKEKINKRLKIELNICINMAKDQSVFGQGKALNFLMGKIKKSIICDGIKKDMLAFLQEYKGDFDKEKIEKGLRKILNEKLKNYEKKLDSEKLDEVKNKNIQMQLEKKIELTRNSIEETDKNRENTNTAKEKYQETFNPVEKQKIHLNELNAWNVDLHKNLDEDNIYKELKGLDFGKTMGNFVFSSKIDESYLPTNKTITNLTTDQQEIEVSQDLNNLASFLKKYNFFKLKEKDFELSDERFKLMIQNMHEVDPSEMKDFEKLRVQKYLSRVDFIKHKKKFVISPKPAKSFSNIQLSTIYSNNMKK